MGQATLNYLERSLARGGWHSLRSWGTHRLIKTCYAWLIIVPLAAKLLARIPGPYQLDFPGVNRPVVVVIDLPFSWKIFFFMALAFALGQFLYAINCPRIIRDFANFEEYRASHKGVGPISDWLRWLTTRRRRAKDFVDLHKSMTSALRLGDVPRQALNKFLEKVLECPNTESREGLYFAYKKALYGSLQSADVISDVFDALRKSARRVFRGWAVFCSLSFFVGFILFLIVLTQNTLFVCSFLADGGRPG